METATPVEGVRVHALMPPAPGSELSLTSVALEPAGATEVGDAEADVLVHVLAGSGALAHHDGTRIDLAAGRAAFVAASERARCVAADDGVTYVRVLAGPRCDRHAPLGEPQRSAGLDLEDTESATGNRAFQVLFDHHNGSQRATCFVGAVPPGRSSWHFHLYDEIVYILDGEGLYHLNDGSESFRTGSAFRVRAREVHIVENTGSRDLVLLGVFTPAGSPAAAYLAQAPEAD